MRIPTSTSQDVNSIPENMNSKRTAGKIDVKMSWINLDQVILDDQNISKAWDRFVPQGHHVLGSQFHVATKPGAIAAGIARGIRNT